MTAEWLSEVLWNGLPRAAMIVPNYAQSRRRANSAASTSSTPK